VSAKAGRSGRSGSWLGWGLVALGLGAVSLLRAPLTAKHRLAEQTTDVYVLPEPESVVRLSMGWRAAFADVLWSHVLVSQGLHMRAKRRFENLSRFYDAINTLDPTLREPYLFADALFTMQGNTTPHEEVLKAREVMERGARALPNDAEVWSALGEFVTFLAPAGFLSGPEENARWRKEGAAYLEHAAELGTGDSRVSWRAIGGASVLDRAGERDAAIRFMKRTLAITDDPELIAYLEAQLSRLAGEKTLEAQQKLDRELKALWKAELPSVTRTSILVLGPPRPLGACAGPSGGASPCPLSWKSWAEDRATASGD
jgi:hypothetical protein